MNRFATSSEPGGQHHAAGLTPKPSMSLLANIRMWLKGISGLDAYDRYLDHHAAHHPGECVMAEPEFWRSRWDNESRNPKARCC